VTIAKVQLVEKSGGKSGRWRRSRSNQWNSKPGSQTAPR